MLRLVAGNQQVCAVGTNTRISERIYNSRTQKYVVRNQRKFNVLESKKKLKIRSVVINKSKCHRLNQILKAKRNNRIKFLVSIMCLCEAVCYQLNI